MSDYYDLTASGVQGIDIGSPEIVRRNDDDKINDDDINDISINYEQAFASGVRYIWIKASEGANSIAPFFSTYAKEAADAGLLVSGYHWVRPDSHPGPSGARQEAANFVEVLQDAFDGGYGSLRPMIDFETTEGKDFFESAEDAVLWVTAFCDYVKANLAVTPIFYTNYNTAVNCCDGLVTEDGSLHGLTGMPLCLANYDQDPTVPKFGGWEDCMVWQYQENQKPSYVKKGDVDFNSLQPNYTLNELQGGAGWPRVPLIVYDHSLDGYLIHSDSYGPIQAMGDAMGIAVSYDDARCLYRFASQSVPDGDQGTPTSPILWNGQGFVTGLIANRIAYFPVVSVSQAVNNPFCFWDNANQGPVIAKPLTIEVYDQPIAGFLFNGDAYAPLMAVAQAVGVTVTFDQSRSIYTLNNQSAPQSVQVESPDTPIFWIDDQTMLTGIAIDGQGYFPLAQIARVLNLPVLWDDDSPGPIIPRPLTIHLPDSELPGLLINGIPYGPIGAICQQLGLAITWHDAQKAVTAADAPPPTNTGSDDHPIFVVGGQSLIGVMIEDHAWFPLPLLVAYLNQAFYGGKSVLSWDQANCAIKTIS